ALAPVYAHPAVLDRALAFVPPPPLPHGAKEAERREERLALPECPGAVVLRDATVQEADGLEWLLRLGVLWQQVAAAPLRRTQQGDFFKRDLDRLRTDPLLTSPAPDSLADVPDAALFAIALAGVAGVVAEKDGEMRASSLPA